jgi:hypothetical protein
MDVPLVASRVHAAIPGAADMVFARVVSLDPARLFPGFGPLPPIARVSDQSGPWWLPGSTRTLHFADGNTAEETVRDVDRPSRFVSRMSGFSGRRGTMLNAVTQRWRFEPRSGPDGPVIWITWRVELRPHSFLALPVVFIAIGLFGRGSLRAGIDGALAADRRKEQRR